MSEVYGSLRNLWTTATNKKYLWKAKCLDLDGKICISCHNKARGEVCCYYKMVKNYKRRISPLKIHLFWQTNKENECMSTGKKVFLLHMGNLRRKQIKQNLKAVFVLSNCWTDKNCNMLRLLVSEWNTNQINKNAVQVL